MVARSQEVPSYTHLILPSQEDDYGIPQGAVYYDLSQSCCPRPVYLRTGQNGGAHPEMAMDVAQVDSTREHQAKKRKASSYHEGSDDDTGDDSKSVRTDDHKKQNHSEIEKRRRDKMNTYITELSAMVPMCHAMSRKLDKLTVLRMAVQHMKTIRGAVNSYTDGNYKPAFLSDLQLKQLIKQAAEGFVFVVGCDRGRILYVSESVSQALNYTQSDLLGQSWFDILHPKDVAKVKEQLASSHLSPRERFIDAKISDAAGEDRSTPEREQAQPGVQEVLFLQDEVQDGHHDGEGGSRHHHRMPQEEEAARPRDVRRYRVIQCTGYLKPWATAKMCLEEEKEAETEGDLCNLSCLVAMGRVVLIPLPHPRPLRSYHTPINVRPLQFISRHAMDGKFLFVDQRATLVLGFLPQELLGTSMYEYYYKEDICHLAESHKAALQSKESITTKVYRFRSKEGNYVQLQSEWKSFRNPWTKEGEYLVAKNSRLMTNFDSQVESSVERTEGSNQSQGNFDYYPSSQNNGTDIPGRDIPKFISSNVEASNIGRQIAEEVIDEQRKALDSPTTTNNSTPSPSHLQSYTEVGVKYSLSSCDLSLTFLRHSKNFGTLNELQSGISPPDRQSILTESNCTGQTITVGKYTNGNDDNYSAIRNNVTLSSLGSDAAGGDGDEMMEMIGSAVSPQQAVPNDGNDEAAMAVIMSLLEADAGLGGPVDFTGLPWPLP
ncbi:protein cycle isoform X2 [Halyomorpha halys]|uniref:protein cycle isoform X2 n=1 Tax=Halyomorpha halys TaxID=286706 RepID=UPI000D0C8A90|nr:protein cycle isoform X2 [Halyomorpha halys]